MWSLIALMPPAFASGWAFTSGLARASNPSRSPLFDTATRFVPEQWWGVGWYAVGVACLVGGVVGWWQWLRFAVVVAWALSTGMLFSVLWARFKSGQTISGVGLGWAYSIWANCMFSILLPRISGPNREIHQ